MRFHLILLCALVCTGAAGAIAADSGFSGRVAVELLDNIENDHRLRLLEDFSFRDPNGRVWTARAGGIVDGMPAPAGKPAWFRLQYPGRLRKAAVVHDYYVAEKREPWRDVHRMYFYANLAEGVSSPEAKIAYMLIYAAGWRWEPRGSSCYGSCHAAASILAWRPDVEIDSLQPLTDWIWASDPGLDDIDRRADKLIRRPGPHLFSQGY